MELEGSLESSISALDPEKNQALSHKAVVRSVVPNPACAALLIHEPVQWPSHKSLWFM